jgi:hypothetical protein
LLALRAWHERGAPPGVAEVFIAAIWSVIVDDSDLSRWFAEYLDAFAACGRGERDTASLLAYYSVPLLLTTDAGFFALTSDDQVAAAVQQQVDGMRAAEPGAGAGPAAPQAPLDGCPALGLHQA